jgi:NADP-dependent 3-hydroxy acid dehydrogenase YdfG
MSIAEMQTKLKGKVAIVTGASAGVGWHTAKALAQEGVKIVATARREHRLEQLTSEIRAKAGEAAYYVGDASRGETAEKTAALALQSFGRIDILINNAGMGNYKKLVETSEDEYDEMMDANMRSSFVFSRFVAPHLIAQRSGTVLFISSVAGMQGFPNEAVYCATKFAQVGFAQALDGELRGHGVRVGVICPGGVKTEFAIGKGRTTQSVADSYMMEASEVADAIVFACMQDSHTRVLQMTIRHLGAPQH